MGPIRLRRANPLTLVVLVLLCIGAITFMLSPSSQDSASSKLRKASAASNPLSPPTSPFRKQSSKSGVKQIPPVVHYYLNNVNTSSDPAANGERVLILTPLARFYQQYWDNLLRLTYPHELITLAFIIPKTREGNAATSANFRSGKEAFCQYHHRTAGL
jgi:mannan polymerase complexes MNN9 subunit